MSERFTSTLEPEHRLTCIRWFSVFFGGTSQLTAICCGRSQNGRTTNGLIWAVLKLEYKLCGEKRRELLRTHKVTRDALKAVYGVTRGPGVLFRKVQRR